MRAASIASRSPGRVTGTPHVALRLTVARIKGQGRSARASNADVDILSTTSSSSSSSLLSCPHFNECSGCTLSEGLSSPPAFKEASEWFKKRGVDLKERRDDRIHGWRCRARLAVRRTSDDGDVGKASRSPAPPCSTKVAIGLFRAGTHDVSSIPECVAHHPRINEASEAVGAAVERLGTRVYGEGEHDEGGLRYLQLTAVSPLLSDDGDPEVTSTPIHEDPSAQVQLVLVWGSDGSRPRARMEAEELAEALWEGRERGKKLFHSIYLSWQPSPGNAVMGSSYERFSGPEVAWQRISVGGSGGGGGSETTTTTATVAVALSPAAFSQANPAAFGSLVGELAEVWSSGRSGGKISAVADLHAGAGAVGLSLAAAAAADERRSPLSSLERVVAVDCVGAGRVPLSASAALFRRGPRERGRERSERSGTISVAFHEARAGDDPSRWLRGADAAVVDPPRKGLLRGDSELLRMLSEDPPDSLRRFAYISCHFPSLARDAEVLLGENRDGEGDDDPEQRPPFWKLSHGAARIFFPGADHVECLAVFERV